MALKLSAIAFSLIVATAPLTAAPPETNVGAGAPAADPGAKYCLRVMPRTGSLIERVQCWTRQDWTDQGVDVDKEWAEEGVAVINEDGTRTLKS